MVGFLESDCQLFFSCRFEYEFKNILSNKMYFFIFLIVKVEAYYEHEREVKEAIEEALESLLLYQLKDFPIMNKIWSFLVTCIQNRNPVVSSCSLTAIPLFFLGDFA